MRILVTGGNGQLGLSLRKISGGHPGYRFIFTDLPEADITDDTAMRKLAAETGAEAIINCAAYTAVDKAESEPEKACLINAGGPGILARMCKERKIPLVHISTDYVFGGQNEKGDGTEAAVIARKPLTEEDIPSPQSVYGHTKLEGERAVEESGCNAAVIRTSWLYSEFGGNFVKTMLRLGKEKDAVSVVDDQTGCPTYAPGLAEAIIRLIEDGIHGFNLYHYSDAGETTWYGFAKEIFRQAGIATAVKPISTTDYPAPAKRPRYSVLSKEKIISKGIEITDWKASLQACLGALSGTGKN